MRATHLIALAATGAAGFLAGQLLPPGLPRLATALGWPAAAARTAEVAPDLDAYVALTDARIHRLRSAADALRAERSAWTRELETLRAWGEGGDTLRIQQLEQRISRTGAVLAGTEREDAELADLAQRLRAARREGAGAGVAPGPPAWLEQARIALRLHEMGGAAAPHDPEPTTR